MNTGCIGSRRSARPVPGKAALPVDLDFCEGAPHWGSMILLRSPPERMDAEGSTLGATGRIGPQRYSLPEPGQRPTRVRHG